MKNLKLSENFSLKEFNCKCGCAMPVQVLAKVKELVIQLEVIRKIVGNKKMIIVSGYRCASHNNTVGGARHSQHMLGNAADFYVDGLSVSATQKFVLNALAVGTLPPSGLGCYATFTHYDNRGYNARWFWYKLINKI